MLATLQPLPHREYSIASVMADGAVELLLRRQLRADGTPGIGSGWLCDHAAIDEPVQLRLRRNDNFHGVPADVPLLLIGNGTGIAGLRAHLRRRHRRPGIMCRLLLALAAAGLRESRAEGHRGMFVGEPKARAGDHDGRGAVAVEGEEPHARFARSVAHVGAHVELVEIRKPG